MKRPHVSTAHVTPATGQTTFSPAERAILTLCGLEICEEVTCEDGGIRVLREFAIPTDTPRISKPMRRLLVKLFMDSIP